MWKEWQPHFLTLSPREWPSVTRRSTWDRAVTGVWPGRMASHQLLTEMLIQILEQVPTDALWGAEDQ